MTNKEAELLLKFLSRYNDDISRIKNWIQERIEHLNELAYKATRYKSFEGYPGNVENYKVWYEREPNIPLLHQTEFHKHSYTGWSIVISLDQSYWDCFEYSSWMIPLEAFVDDDIFIEYLAKLYKINEKLLRARIKEI